MRPSKKSSICSEFWFVVWYSGTFCHVTTTRPGSCLREIVPPAAGLMSSYSAATRGSAKCSPSVSSQSSSAVPKVRLPLALMKKLEYEIP